MAAYSNPFTKQFRRKAFDESVEKLKSMFPKASEDWVRKQAWATARKVSE